MIHSIIEGDPTEQNKAFQVSVLKGWLFLEVP
jgi:hypothetical protein